LWLKIGTIFRIVSVKISLYTKFEMKNCIFCQIVEGKVPAKIVYKNKDVIAFKDINPIAPVHILIIPQKHIESLSKTSDKDIKLLGAILRSAANIAKENKLEAFRVLNVNGEKAGQTVKHIHFHLVGGWRNVSLKMESDPEGLRRSQ